jgi:signal transduction histidine kinase
MRPISSPTNAGGDNAPWARGMNWLSAGLLPPLVALALQWGLWAMLQPLLWFLFYPAVFVSSWLGGLRSGALATLVSIAFVFGFFVTPAELDNIASSLAFSTVAFFAMGILFAVFHERLREANHKAHLALTARDEFLQIASHELKTPLTPLQLELDNLQRALDRSGIRDQRMHAQLGIATRQTERLERLVGSLLDASAIAEGHLQLDLERCDLSTIVGNAALEHQREAGRAGSTLEVVADTPLVGEWDRARVEQIVGCLLSNAIKYGSGKPVAVEVRALDGSVRISVHDGGIGMDPQVLARIFGRFERGVSLRHYGGMGFGLFIARGLAEAHGGSLVAESRPGEGSTFTLVLPWKNAEEHRPVIGLTAEAHS